MTATIYCSQITSPLGTLYLEGDGQFLTGLYLPDHQGQPSPRAGRRESAAPFDAVREQLAEYFAGARQAFDLPLQLAGSPFQLRVWQELVRIPYGSTITYAQLGQRIGRPAASRAVGQANSRNPISIIVPCHRVIGSSGKLTGYAGGLDAKRWLLDWERTSCCDKQDRPQWNRRHSNELSGVPS